MYAINEYTGWEIGNVDHVFFDRKSANKWIVENIEEICRPAFHIERVKVHG
jgi:hypothetical protein